MKTRVDKYFDDNTSFAPKRTAKNTELYEEIKNSELDNFNIGSNAKVIADNPSQIDIDKIKEILEKNYQETPKRRTIKFETVEEKEIELEKTREYDINAILEKAREEKEVDYQSERLKKIRDTQYDILKNLELESEPQAKVANDRTKEELLELIHTININEKQKKEIQKLEAEEKDLDPLDILSDLRGDENTVVAGAKEFTEELENQEQENLLKKQEKKEIEEAMSEDIDNSFYTNSMSFSKNDFADLDDDGPSVANIIIKVLIVLVFLAIVAGLVLFLNEFLNLGWF